MVDFKLQCRTCKETNIVSVTQSEINEFNAGIKNIQDCFPKLSAEERELIKTQTCGKCWDKIFPSEEE